jgi:methionyl-tRNA formyltransferase
MRLAFAGTPEFAAQALASLLDAGHEVALVLTQPDRPAGRGMRLQASAVKQLCVQRGLSVAQPRGLRLDGRYADDARAAQTALQDANIDAMVVAAYGLILPAWALDLPRLGCFNIHASLLPRWRGAAPILRAIEAGDTQTGVTIMQMDAGLDTGDMLLVERLPILDTDTASSLHDRLACLGAALMVRTLAELPALNAQAQPQAGVCYAAKIERKQAAIDWTLSARQISQGVRAFNPFPVATTSYQAEVLKVWSAHELEAEVAHKHAAQAPGMVLSVSPEAVLVATGEGVLAVTELQRAGAKRMPLADFLRGCAIEANRSMR